MSAGHHRTTSERKKELGSTSRRRAREGTQSWKELLSRLRGGRAHKPIRSLPRSPLPSSGTGSSGWIAQPQTHPKRLECAAHEGTPTGKRHRDRPNRIRKSLWDRVILNMLNPDTLLNCGLFGAKCCRQVYYWSDGGQNHQHAPDAFPAPRANFMSSSSPE